ncbi:sensor histidine kinase [Halobaculum limi]|uniref:sensor histidine kinase n=1 Tax=Halobaculum limi TaxID=3031916 RepID=UPI0024072B18|nr:histidine kinase N-terminal 7TM domain-containing protein [Halobaculum sp. YSMS11]
MVHASDILVAAVFGSALLSAATGTLAYLRTRERRDHAGTAFVALTYGAALWAGLLGLQLLAGQTPLATTLVKAKWIAATPIVTTSLLFGLYYSGRGDWVTARRTLLLSLEPAVAAAVIVLNPGGVFFAGIVERTAVDLPILVAVPGVGFVVHLTYGFCIGMAFVGLLVEAALRSSGPYRYQATTLAVGASGVLVSSLVYVLEPTWAPPFDITPLVFGLASIALLFAMYRFDLFNVAPVAHETVFANLDDAIVVVDAADRVLETNPAAREAFGIDGDGVGLAADDVLPDDDGMGDLLDGDDTAVTLADGGVSTFAASDATPKYFEATCEPLGRDGVRLLVFRDVTEQTRVERRYRSYVEHADDIIAVADPDGVLEYVSPAVEPVLGRPPEAVTGEVFTDLVHPDDRREVAQPFAQILDAPGESVRMTFRVEHGDGGWRTLEGVGVNRFHDPHIGGYLLTLRDETRRDRYEQRLRVLTRVLRHDLRNELNVVLGYADTIATMDESRAGQYAERIHRSAERLSSLGERVRGVDRTLQNADHGGRPVDVAAVVEEVARRARDRYPEASVTVDAAAVTAYADELLVTAVWNVVENAIRHHDGDAPTVSVTVECDSETVEIRVADDGPGIPDEDRSAVESGHETQLQHASGIGLWLVRWILDGVDGELTFVDAPVSADAPHIEGAPGAVVVLCLRAVTGDAEATSGLDQVDPWGTAATAPERTDGGPGEWRPQSHSGMDASVDDERDGDD